VSNDVVAENSISNSSAPNQNKEEWSQGEGAPPPVVVVSGRVGKCSEVNGRYELSKQESDGRPVYDHELEQLRLYHINGHWAVGPRNESSRREANLARCRSDASHPLRICAFWEFIDREDDKGHMVTMETRVYAMDRSVRVTDPDSVPDVKPAEARSAAGPAAPASVAEHAASASGSSKGGYPASKPISAQNAAPSSNKVDETNADVPAEAINGGPTSKEPLSWLLHSSAEIEGDKVKAQVTVKDGIDGADLSLDVASCVLRVAHGKEILELALPVPVDSAAVPAAKWSKKTRTLTTRLEIQRG